jgi:ferredoxin-NADP reductase
VNHMTIMETKPVNDQNELERDVVVTEAVAIATDVVMLRLADASGADLPEWAPGAHIDVTLDGNIRQYSLCGDPNERKSWRIAVLREEAGRGGSKLLHERARHGLQLTARGPRNHFTLRPAAEYLFVAGGIGITPLLPMVAAAEAAGTPWRLVYGARSADRLSFVPELEQYGSKVTFQPEDTHGMLDLKQLVVELPQGGEIYACGPTGLLDRLEELCTEAGKPRHIERFSADPKALEGASGTSSFEVIAETSGVTVTVPPGTSIVRALEDAGVDVLTSCEEGVCSTCETRVLAGIPEHHDSVLNDDERERNDVMMICVSRAKTPSLTLDI